MQSTVLGRKPTGNGLNSCAECEFAHAVPCFSPVNSSNVNIGSSPRLAPARSASLLTPCHVFRQSLIAREYWVQPPAGWVQRQAGCKRLASAHPELRPTFTAGSFMTLLIVSNSVSLKLSLSTVLARKPSAPFRRA